MPYLENGPLGIFLHQPYKAKLNFEIILLNMVKRSTIPLGPDFSSGEREGVVISIVRI